MWKQSTKLWYVSSQVILRVIKYTDWNLWRNKWKLRTLTTRFQCSKGNIIKEIKIQTFTFVCDIHNNIPLMLEAKSNVFTVMTYAFAELQWRKSYYKLPNINKVYSHFHNIFICCMLENFMKNTFVANIMYCFMKIKISPDSWMEFSGQE